MSKTPSNDNGPRDKVNSSCLSSAMPSLLSPIRSPFHSSTCPSPLYSAAAAVQGYLRPSPFGPSTHASPSASSSPAWSLPPSGFRTPIPDPLSPLAATPKRQQYTPTAKRPQYAPTPLTPSRDDFSDPEEEASSQAASPPPPLRSEEATLASPPYFQPPTPSERPTPTSESGPPLPTPPPPKLKSAPPPENSPRPKETVLTQAAPESPPESGKQAGKKTPMKSAEKQGEKALSGAVTLRRKSSSNSSSTTLQSLSNRVTLGAGLPVTISVETDGDAIQLLPTTLPSGTAGKAEAAAASSSNSSFDIAEIAEMSRKAMVVQEEQVNNDTIF